LRSKNGAKMVQKWCKNGAKMAQKWRKNGAKMAQKWRNNYPLVDKQGDQIFRPMGDRLLT
jgi:hypothetical protein